MLLNVFSTLWLENGSNGGLHGSVWRADHLGSECGKPGGLTCQVQISCWAKRGAVSEL